MAAPSCAGARRQVPPRQALQRQVPAPLHQHRAQVPRRRAFFTCAAQVRAERSRSPVDRATLPLLQQLVAQRHATRALKLATGPGPPRLPPRLPGAIASSAPSPGEEPLDPSLSARLRRAPPHRLSSRSSAAPPPPRPRRRQQQQLLHPLADAAPGLPRRHLETNSGGPVASARPTASSRPRGPLLVAPLCSGGQGRHGRPCGHAPVIPVPCCLLECRTVAVRLQPRERSLPPTPSRSEWPPPPLPFLAGTDSGGPSPSELTSTIGQPSAASSSACCSIASLLLPNEALVFLRFGPTRPGIRMPSTTTNPKTTDASSSTTAVYHYFLYR